MKKLLFISIMVLLVHGYEIKPFPFDEVDDTDLFESRCAGQWCSPVTLAPHLQKQYKSCNYFAKNDEVKCTGINGEIKTIKVYSSDKIEINNKNFIGTYLEKREGQEGQPVQLNLYKQTEQTKKRAGKNKK